MKIDFDEVFKVGQWIVAATVVALAACSPQEKASLEFERSKPPVNEEESEATKPAGDMVPEAFALRALEELARFHFDARILLAQKNLEGLKDGEKKFVLGCITLNVYEIGARFAQASYDCSWSEAGWTGKASWQWKLKGTQEFRRPVEKGDPASAVANLELTVGKEKGRPVTFSYARSLTLKALDATTQTVAVEKGTMSLTFERSREEVLMWQGKLEGSWNLKNAGAGKALPELELSKVSSIAITYHEPRKAKSPERSMSPPAAGRSVTLTLGPKEPAAFLPGACPLPTGSFAWLRETKGQTPTSGTMKVDKYGLTETASGGNRAWPATCPGF